MTRWVLAVSFGLLALALGAPNATANDEATAPGTVTVLGKTYCFSWAPADAPCDLRIGSHPNAEQIFGMTLCKQPVPSGVTCDVTFPSRDAAAREHRRAGLEPFVVPMFGQNVCFGDVANPDQCAFRFGTDADTAS